MTEMEDPGGMPFDGARITLRGQIADEVIDVNGHMNVSGYDDLFDRAEYNLFKLAGIWEPWIIARQQSLFRLEKLICYERELVFGQNYEVRSRVVATDGRRIHHFHELWDLRHDRRSACFDGLAIHVDLTLRRSVPIADPDVHRAMHRLAAESGAAAPPRGIVRRGADFRRC